MKVAATICLSYAILMLLIDGLFSLFSLSQHANISALIEDKLIPYIISIVSMTYCIIHICQHWVSNGHPSSQESEGQVIDSSEQLTK